MVSSNGRAKRSGKGLLTPDNCVVALIDHQPQIALRGEQFRPLGHHQQYRGTGKSGARV